MPTDLPLYGVAPYREVKGANDFYDTTAPALKVATFSEAFEERWNTDAHFVTYAPAGVEPGTPYPRCNKASLSAIRSAGYDLIRHSFAVDWDTPGHLPWGEQTDPKEYEQKLIEVCEKFPLAAEFSCVYLTNNGMRMVYVLDRGIPVDDSESKLRWFLYKLRSHGLKCDELIDWSRLFRLPRVVRDGKGTESNPFFDIEISKDTRLPVDELGEASKSDRVSVYADIQEFDLPQPEEDDVIRLIEVPSNGRMKQTDWAKEAKRRLQGRECFDTLFNHVPLAEPGNRNNQIHQYVGQATSLLFQQEGTTPEHIYALFLGPVRQMEEDEDWLAILWSAVGRLWAKEEAKHRAKEMEKQDEEQQAEEKVGTVIEGMREWCDHPALFGDDSEAEEFSQRHLIATSGASFYLIDSDGYYRQQSYNPNTLISGIRTHIPELIKTFDMKADGSGVREVGFNSIVNRHATVVNDVVIQPGIKRGYIERIDSPEATLVIPGFRLNENLKPEYDEEVDEWLKVLFGSQYEDACRWIAFALAFDEGPICAMSVMGGQGVGKKLLTQGLSECLRVPMVATDADLVSNYQYGLLKTPFLVVNEGWSQRTGGKHAADKFREITSGDPIEINRRYKDPVYIKNPVRVVFTANNLDVIKMLCYRRDLSQADREALAIRLMHFDVGSEASIWLRRKGGMAYTGRQGRRWIAPDAGGKSDFIVAKHFLWLYKSRHDLWKPGQRLLVEGTGSQDLMFEMQTQVGSATLVVEAILRMIESPAIKRDMVVDSDSGRVWVLTNGILEFWRDTMGPRVRGENLTANAIASVLDGLCCDESAPPREIPGHSEKGRRRWRELDLAKLYKAAHVHGFPSLKLAEVLSNRLGITSDMLTCE